MRKHDTLHDLKIYFIKRFSRIYTVFLPALTIGGLLDYTGCHWFDTQSLYRNAYHISAMNFNVIDRLNIETYFINIEMMQTSLGPTLGSNGPLWSLANEWWYYIFPLLFILVLKHKSLIIKATVIIAIIVILSVLNINIMLYSIVWLMGMLGTKLKMPIMKYSFEITSIALLLAFLISRIHLFNLSLFVYDFIIAVTLIILIILPFQNKITLYFEKYNKQLANFSYTLYLFHFPFLLLLLSILSNSFSVICQQPTLKTYTLFTSFLIIIYIYSYIAYRLFEKNTNIVRQKLEKI